MFDIVCMFVAFLLIINSEEKYQAAALIVFCEFVLHGIAFKALTSFDVSSGSMVYLSYALIQVIAISLLVKVKAHCTIIALIFINLTYNMLTTSQYVFNTIDFFSHYPYFVGAIMILELCYLAGITVYARPIRNGFKLFRIRLSDALFRVRRRLYNWTLS